PGVAEHLPFPDDSFDLALAQLVVHFMTDPVSGLQEMARVTRPGGLVAACVWDHAGGGGPLTFGGPCRTWIRVPVARPSSPAFGRVTWRNCAKRPA
ncbi:MAG: class I SAM-dependent methyltransferase, partial [Candidatus Limnocylindria bacterium]